jgi:hypothetical protein
MSVFQHWKFYWEKKLLKKGQLGEEICFGYLGVNGAV